MPALVTDATEQRLLVDLQLKVHAVEIDGPVIGVLYPQFDCEACFQTFAGQRLDTDQFDAQWVARGQGAARSQGEQQADKQGADECAVRGVEHAGFPLLSNHRVEDPGSAAITPQLGKLARERLLQEMPASL